MTYWLGNKSIKQYLTENELKELKEQHGYNYLINIDGGIKDVTLPLVKDYLDLAVSGSYIANAEDPLRNLNILKNM